MSDTSKAPQGQSTFSGCLARFFWLLVGNAALLLLAVKIAHGEARALSVFDIVYWLTVAGVIAVRYLDVTRLGGQTSDGDPATLTHWRKHAASLGVVALALWLAAHGAAMTGWFR